MRTLLVLAFLAFAPTAQAYDVVHDKYVPVKNSAGETITVDLWRPAENGKPLAGPFPVIVEQSPYRDWQTPYPTKGENPSNGGDPTEWAQRGYVFVFGDVPGTGGSTGQWCLWCRAQVDSAVSILEWAAGQPWSNGRVGWYGSSYPGILGLLVAERNPPALKALRIGQPYGDLYDDLAYIGGVQRGEDLGILAGGFTGLSRDTGPYCVPGATCDAQSWADAWSTRATSPPATFIQDFETRKLYDDWYRERSVLPDAGKITAPTLLMAGWEDMLGRGTVNVFSAIKAEKRLVMSASTHVPLFPAGDANAVHKREEERWFDRWLRDAPDKAEPGGPVRLFTEQGPGYRSFESWPPPATATDLFMAADGVLAPSAPPAGEDAKVIDPQSGHAGGRWLLRTLVPDSPEEYYSPDGPQDQNLENGSVITYRTPALDRDTEITGVPVAHLVASTTATDTILNVRLIDESPEGTQANFAYLVDSGWRLASLRNSTTKPEPPEPGKPFDTDVELWPLSYVWKKGHHIRVDIAFADTPRMAAPTAAGTTTIHRGRSRITLPVAGATPAVPCRPTVTAVRGRLHRLFGSSTCAARVQVALRRGARPVVRRRGALRLAPRRACGKRRPVARPTKRRGCARRRWLATRGPDAAWRLGRVRLPRGRYRIAVRGVDASGKPGPVLRAARRVR